MSENLVKVDALGFRCIDTPRDSMHCVEISPCGSYVAAVSFDEAVAYWDVADQGRSVRCFYAGNALLSCCWSADSSLLFYGGIDGNLGMWNLANGTNQVIGNHGSEINNVFFYGETGWVATAGWDNEIKFWDGRNVPVYVLNLPTNMTVFSIHCVQSMIAIATNTRQLLFYQLQHDDRDPFQVNYQELWMPNPLTHQTSCIRLNPDGLGFAVCDITGSVVMSTFDGEIHKWKLPAKNFQKRNGLPSLFFLEQYLFVTDNYGCIHISNFKEKRKYAIISDYDDLPITAMHYHKGTRMLAVCHGYVGIGFIEEGRVTPMQSPTIYTLHIDILGN